MNIVKRATLAEQVLETPPRPMGPILYHGTSCQNAVSIMTQGVLIESNDHHNAPGISTSDALHTAKHFASYQDSKAWNYWRSMHREPYEFVKLTGVILELDATKVRAVAKIVPFAFREDWAEEQEWRIMTQRLPLEGVLRRVRVDPKDIEFWCQHVPDQAKSLRALLNWKP